MTDRPGGPLLFLDVDGPLLPFGGSVPSAPSEIADVPRLARLRLDVVRAVLEDQDAGELGSGPPVCVGGRRDH